jgi:hypothetical protein
MNMEATQLAEAFKAFKAFKRFKAHFDHLQWETAMAAAMKRILLSQ